MKEVIEARKTRKEAKEKLNELYSQRETVEGRIAEIEGLTKKTGEYQQENPLTKAANALLKGEDISPVSLAPLFEEREDLIRKKRIIDEAIHIQRQKIEETTTALSIALGRARRNEYKDLIRRHVQCLIALGKTIQESAAFHDSFRQEGLSSHAVGKVTHFTRVGFLSDKWSHINCYLRELIEYGWITKEEIEEMKARA
jgi:hypothetical protein